MGEGTGARPGRARGLWLCAVALAVIAAVAVPYGLLAGPEPGLTVAAFWVGFGLVVVLLILAGTARWKDAP